MKITEKYRPRKLSDVAAQTTAVSHIENSIARSGLAGSSWWLTGATGTGKTTIARIIANSFTENDFTITEYVGRDISVDDIREYQTHMAFFPMGKGRCLIINEAQDMSDSAVSLLLALVERINESKHDMIVFTAMADVLELKNDPMNRWRALVGRCNLIEFAETDSPVFRQEVAEYLEGVAASEGVLGVDIQTLCEKTGWSIRAALNALDMQERGTPEPVADAVSIPEVKPTPKVKAKDTAGVKPLKLKVTTNGYAVKDRATSFDISRLGERWRVTLTNHMTKANKKGGRLQKFYSTLEEVETAYKCLKGLSTFASKQVN